MIGFGFSRVAPLVALCALAAPRASADELWTASYVVQITEHCPEGEVGCRDVTYVGKNIRTGKSITLAAAGQASAPTETLAQRVGVQIDSGYATARARLLATSWKADTGWGQSGVRRQLAYRQYPEVLCGDGHDPACTGRFVKSGQAILVSIDQKTSALRVLSVDED